MPLERSFVDVEQDHRPYDFELRDGSWDSVRLFEGERWLATTRVRLGTDNVLSIQPEPELGEVQLGRTTVRSAHDGERSYVWPSYAEILDSGKPAITIEIARAGVLPRSSEAPNHYQLWAHQAVWAVFDPGDHPVLTAHRAWRDSEEARKMVGGFRLKQTMDQRQARLVAVCASLFWFTDPGVFDQHRE